MTPKPLTNDGGASHGHVCPQCGASVANVAESAFFGGGWLFYGEGDDRFYFKDNDGNQCNGDWGKHYHHHGASFLWLRIEASPDVGQMRMEL